MKIEIINTEKLIPYENNARMHDNAIEAIKNSIAQFGFKQPIVVDSEMVIIIGHGRLKAAKELGINEVPVHIASNLTPEQAQALRIVDNKTSELSEWDFQRLIIDIEELTSSNEIDLTTLGFDQKELNKLLNEHSEIPEGETDEDEVPEMPESEPVSKRGMIYQLGNHRVACGDNQDKSLLGRLMGADKAQLLLTDPPYGVNYSGGGGGGTRKKIANDEKQGSKLEEFLVKSVSVATEYLDPNGVFYIWFAMAQAEAFYRACDRSKLPVRTCIVWVKNHFVLSFADYKQQYEPCLYGWKGKNHEFYGGLNASTVLRADKPLVSAEHPTMKPVGLFRHLILNSSAKGDRVLDIFAGSGTTVIAAEETGRVARVVEYEEKYVDVIRRRWAEFVHGVGCDWEELTPEVCDE